MTLPASGSIALSQIATEFGGSAPHALTEYYRGGANVQNRPPNLGIPTSGAIDLTDFYGTSSSPAVDLASPTVVASGGTTATATARITVDSAGLQQSKSGTASYVTENTWLNFGANTDYEVRATFGTPVGTGSTGGSAAGSWISCAAGGEWTAAASLGFTYVVDVLLEIRYVPTGVVLASATTTLDSERF